MGSSVSSSVPSDVDVNREIRLNPLKLSGAGTILAGS